MVECQDRYIQHSDPPPMRHISVEPMGQRKFRLLLLLALQVLSGACMHAQDVSDSTPVLRRGSNLVLVPTLVKTGTGEPIFGLTADDFILTDNRAMQTFNCLTLLAPPLFAAKMATMAALDGIHRNVPESVARLTGGAYFKFENRRGLERGLIALSNQIPNSYALSFSPQADSPGLHAIDVRLKNRMGLHVDARRSYWADSSKSPD